MPRAGHPTPTLPLPQALAVHGGRILPGDEIVQVNEQVVVSWGGRGLEGGAGFGSEVMDGELQGWQDLGERGGCGWEDFWGHGSCDPQNA